jgi:UDP-N-acetylglucosamine 2-epimerase (non-hydrolysing)
MACAIRALKHNIKATHIEEGIRSLDLSMPDQINRMVTDSIADYFFATFEAANENLLKNGGKKEAIFYSNVMTDTLMSNRPKFKKPGFFTTLRLQEKNYFFLTMHRPANVDETQKLKE